MTILTPEEEMSFKKWYGEEPESDNYDWRGFYKTEKQYKELKPTLSDYYKENPDYHAYSIGFDGRILKLPNLPTYYKTLEAEKKLNNQVEFKDGRYYISQSTKQQGGKLSKNEIEFLSEIAIKDNNGYWNPNNKGKVVEINSPSISMKNLDYSVLGISRETGERKVMLPNQEYYFGKKTKNVIELPLKK